VRHPLRAALGHLERDVMQVLWRHGELPVRAVQGRLGRPAAYTTVMTTLDRLYKKGFVTRRREGRAFLYTAVSAQHEMEASVTSGLVSELLAGDGAAPLLSNLVDVVAERDEKLLDELERLVRDKRKRRARRQP
jgi:predicted transcriptional regulator